MKYLAVGFENLGFVGVHRFDVLLLKRLEKRHYSTTMLFVPKNHFEQEMMLVFDFVDFEREKRFRNCS